MCVSLCIAENIKRLFQNVRHVRCPWRVCFVDVPVSPI